MSLERLTVKTSHTFTPPRYTVSGAKLAALVLALSAGVAGGITPAYAGPDDGKYITTQGHVDAPKAFWENDSFSLKNESNVRGNGPEPLPLEQTANWVGKGWSGDGKGTNQYIFTTDNTPSLQWIGEPGKNYYMAPQLPSFNHDPIWAGLGADSNIPVEKFRDGTFATDILSVNGPGTMELFRYTNFGNMADSMRMLSSTTSGLNSYLLHQGTHSHNYTIFSKPGRYEVTYRTVARSADGTETIASKPTTLVWQVGGKKPISGEGTVTSVSTEDRYKAAPEGNLESANYRLSITPHPGRERDGDDKLTDISFTSGSAQKGTLTLFVNGYFLTDLDVVDGKATWDEMLGSEESQIQAVFTPAEGEDAARWVSWPATYKPGESSDISSMAGNGTWPVQIPDARNIVMNTEHYTPTSTEYTVSLEPTENPDISRLRIEFKDKNFRGFINGGLFSEGEDTYPDTPFSATVVDGVAEQYVDTGGYLNGTHPRFDIVPHPDMNVAAFSHRFKDSFNASVAQTEQGKLKITTGAETPDPPADDVAPTPAPTPSPSDAPTPQPTDNPAEPAPSGSSETGLKQCVAGDFKGKYPISAGHLDLKASLRNSALGFAVKDDTGAISPQSVERSANDIALMVHDNAQKVRTNRMADAKFDFLGKLGDKFYLLPDVQSQGIVWPGYNTQDIDYSQLEGPVTLHLEPRSVPTGSNYGLFSGGADPEILMDSSKEDTSLEVAFPTHVHANWAFTMPGNYVFDAYYTATTADGEEVKSEPQQLSFAVGKDAVDGCTVAEASEPVPGASEPADNSGASAPAPSAPSDANHTEPSSGATAPQAGDQSVPSAFTRYPAAQQPAGQMTGTSESASSQQGGSDATSQDAGSAPASGNGVSVADESAGSAGSAFVQSQGSSAGMGSAGTSATAAQASPLRSALASTGFSGITLAAVGAALVIGGIVLTAKRRCS